MGKAKSFLKGASILLGLVTVVGIWPVYAQPRQSARDSEEPPKNRPTPKIMARPGGAIRRQDIDEKGMQALIHDLVSCGTRLTLSSWTDPKRGIGCGRDFVLARLNEIAKQSGGRLEIVVDKFESKSERTGPNPGHLENVYAI